MSRTKRHTPPLEAPAVKKPRRQRSPLAKRAAFTKRIAALDLGMALVDAIDYGEAEAERIERQLARRRGS